LRLIEDKFGSTLRSISIEIIEAVEKGTFLDETVDACFSRYKLPETRRGLVYQIVSGVVRWKGYLDWVLSQLVRKGVKGDIRYLLWISFYQIAYMKKAHYHVVKEAVEYAKERKGVKVANFVNAVLRRFSVERENIPFPADPVLSLSINHSFPGWLINRWLARFGLADTERLCSTLNATPTFTVRIDPNRISKETAISRLNALGISTEEGLLIDSAIRVDKLSPLLNDPLFKEGSIYVQDEASQLVALAVAPQEGEVILDGCAGLGTKTAQMRGLMPGATFVAMDINMGRLRLASEKLNLVRGDAMHPPFGKALFDAILLDAPCSSLGIIRKHPEIKWSRREKDVIAASNYQLDLLRSLWDNLKKGGRMVYSVCSFEAEETVEVLERFSKERAFLLENTLPFRSDKEYFLSLPQETGMDGFFMARLKKI
jgi:16S rRNA (cytosine967-C5)-methyltransferase